jgi:hypothetical protein
LSGKSIANYSWKGEEVVRMTNAMTRIEKAGIGLLTPQGLCIHVQGGRGSMAKTCIHDYQCWHCAYDQWIDAMEAGEKAGRSLKLDGDILAKAA